MQLTLRLISLILLTVLSLTSIDGFARGRFYTWHNTAAAAPVLIYVPDRTTPAQIAQKYIRLFSSNPDLAEIFAGHSPEVQEILDIDFTEVTTDQMQHFAGLISNDKTDFESSSHRIENFRRSLAFAELKPVILPMLWNRVLNIVEFRQFKAELADRLPMLVAMGGEDVHPDHYGAENLYSNNTVHSRDAYEISIIQTYTKHEKGFMLGICRGHQITSVALGYQLTQDVPSIHGDEVGHSNHEHAISIVETTHSLLKNSIFRLSNTRLGRTRIAQSMKIVVNSLHHQAVRFLSARGYTAPRTQLELAAISDDGVVEALEFKNGLGLLLQFHPEKMLGHWLNRAIFSSIGDTVAQQNVVRACSKVY